ncbi:nuclear factor Y [Striga asiatica]|uniref:Nuclear factor Y n=1 Tax=Striga asiatica TaxID=4170 RepID=A0A5A7RGR5_STRAF|nr:nuclear factor Y [Striga asiatica]
MAEQEQGNQLGADEPRNLEIPTRRVKSIMKIDKDINRVNSEALFLIASSTELFLQFLAEKSARVALEKKKRSVRLEHLRVAVKRHRPTSDFLFDSLPMPSRPSEQNILRDGAKSRAGKKATNEPLPFVTRSIDAFFRKST